jgi:flavin-dependent dehydrogenase
MRFGAKVYEGVGVNRVDFSDPNCAAIKYNMGKKEMSTTCRIVVDASGRRTLVGNQLKWRIQDDHFDQYAIHTWFNGYDRRCMASNKANPGRLHFHPLPSHHQHLGLADSDHRPDHEHRRGHAEKEFRQEQGIAREVLLGVHQEPSRAL